MFAEPEWMKKFILTCSNLHPDSDLKKEFFHELENALKPLIKVVKGARSKIEAANVSEAQKYHFTLEVLCLFSE